MVEALKKPHPLKGRKKSAASIRKRLATLKAKREAKARGELVEPSRAAGFRKARKGRRVESRTYDQLVRDMAEIEWCLTQALKKKRLAIRDGVASLTDVTDEDAYLYMAIRYSQGGLQP